MMGDPRESLRERYRAVRGATERLCEPLAVEDQVVQSMPDVSPTKWHLAHTSWFFETFVLEPGLPGYRSPNPLYRSLFNSYYVAVGPMWFRPARGLLSRPTVAEIHAYRRHVDEHLDRFLATADEVTFNRMAPRVELGLHHCQQHQELILTDLKHVLSRSPLYPVYRDRRQEPGEISPLGWKPFAEGLYEIGHEGPGFAFDNEGPRHRVFLEGFRIADRLVTNGEFRKFMEDDGYARPDLWLSDGWAVRAAEDWQAPLYWTLEDGGWREFTLSGLRDLDPVEPVCHVSHSEADAYARWAGARLPTEAEWEVAAADEPTAGGFLESGRFHPAPADLRPGLRQLYGEAWQWTQSAYLPYPGYRPPEGALGEYNGKFMSGQMVLRGASCATPASHARPTYRNFFPPAARWQFLGIRLAADAR
jgi:ergothioneine biosynthesis protein EgtB